MEEKLYEVLTKLEFKCTFANDYLYIQRKKEKIILLVLVYVNNMVVNSLNSHQIFSFKTALDEDFKITDLGELKFMLDIFITQYYTRHFIYLNQSAYIHQVLMCFGMQNTFLVSILLTVKHKPSIFHFLKAKIEK